MEVRLTKDGTYLETVEQARVPFPSTRIVGKDHKIYIVSSVESEDGNPLTAEVHEEK